MKRGRDPLALGPLVSQQQTFQSHCENSAALGRVPLLAEQSLQQTQLGFEVLVLAVFLCHGPAVLLLTRPVHMHGEKKSRSGVCRDLLPGGPSVALLCLVQS